MKKSFRNQKGFSLVEISIVLVVVGLLMGGVLKGQELVKNAKAKSLGNEFKNITTAIYSYQDRYKYLPGDDPDADTRFGLTATKGDGNGSVDTANEQSNFWDHLRKAKLITENVVSGSKNPPHALGGKISVINTLTTNTNLSGLIICLEDIPGEMAGQIDILLDDGKNNAGNYQVSDTKNDYTTSKVNICSAI